MINIETKNKLEKLEQKVEEMERQLKQKTTLENTVKEMEKRLMIYEDKIRSDKGEVTLKKNFVIKNRKGKIPGRSENLDNVGLLYFNDVKTRELNHIFIGSAGSDGFNNNTCVVIRSVKNENGPNIVNNGNIEISLYKEEDLDNNGVVVSGISNFNIADLQSMYGSLKEAGAISSIPDEEGIYVQANGQGKDGFAALAHYEDTGALNTAISVYKDNIIINGIPESDPEVDGAIYNDNGTLKISSVEES